MIDENGVCQCATCKERREYRAKIVSDISKDSEIATLREKLKQEKERADSNYASCERIKGKFEESFKEAKSLRDKLERTQADTLADYLNRQWEWSKRTFGPGRRTGGLTAHIEKEIAEVRAKPEDLSEWVDIIILAMDGYWRHGGKSENLLSDMQEKQDKNFSRKWPVSTSEDEAVEHDRSEDSGIAQSKEPA